MSSSIETFTRLNDLRKVFDWKNLTECLTERLDLSENKVVVSNLSEE